MRHKISMLNMILEPVSAALGSKYKKGKVDKQRRNKPVDKMTKEQKDAILLQKFERLGWVE
jgi:hypothetical protein